MCCAYEGPNSSPTSDDLASFICLDEWFEYPDGAFRLEHRPTWYAMPRNTYIDTCHKRISEDGWGIIEMHIHDVLIIGAGPCGLALAARLREHTPSATFTDDEHQRYHWIRKHGRKMNIKNYKTKKDSLPTLPATYESSECRFADDAEGTSREQEMDVLVLDADGADWLTRWHRLFANFGIENLRSPMFFHVDPADRDALLGYSYASHRESELQPLPGCVGKETSKHRKKKKRNAGGLVSQGGPDIDERDRKDYFTPSSGLFAAHCEHVVKKYRLSKDMVRQERVIDIEYGAICTFTDSDDESMLSDGSLNDDKKAFRISTNKGIRFAHIAILAVGPGNAPSIPQISGLPPAPCEGYSHAMQMPDFPPPHVLSKAKSKKPANMLIVGGGLTSIQLADLALKRGVSKIWLLMRSSLKVKYFDVDLEWVGKYRNNHQAAFWSADTDQDRLEMLLQARNGGSITPRYRKILDKHVECGKVSLCTHTSLTSVSWNEDEKRWSCLTTRPGLELPSMDYIVFATGVQSNITDIPFLQGIQKKYPIEVIGGLPCLNGDLMWCDNIPLFITGRLAGLRLGPGAPNLVGARVGAERIAWNVEDVLSKIKRENKVGARVREANGEDLKDESHDEQMVQSFTGRKNRFDSLVSVGED